MNQEDLATTLESGEACYRSGDVAGAVRHFENIVRIQPDNAEAWNNLGAVAYDQGHHEEAGARFARALEADPGFLPAARNLARLRLDAEDPDAAVILCRTALLKEPDNVDLLNELGQIYLRQGDAHGALACCDASLRADPAQDSLRETVRALKNRMLRRQEEKMASLDRKALSRIRLRIVSPSEFDPDPSRRPLWGDHWVKFELQQAFGQIGVQVVESNPDAVLVLYGTPVDGLPTDTVNMVWVYSHPDTVTSETLRGFDRIYSLSPAFSESLQQMGYEPTATMIGATAKRPRLTGRVHDVVFVGNPRGKGGRKIVADIGPVPFDFKVWGNGWDQILPARYVGGRYYDNRKLDALYAGSLVSVNDHHPDMAREGMVAVKIFDILASGGFAVSDRNAGIESIFGEAVPQYRDAVHLRFLLEEFVARPEKRIRLMESGRKTALQQGWLDRAVEFSEGLVEEVAAKRPRRRPTAPRRNESEKPDDSRPRVLYVDTLSASHAACNVNGMLKAYKKVAHVRAFDYRALAEKHGAAQMNEMLLAAASDFGPTIVHLGKCESVSGDTVRRIREQTAACVIHFYGDFRWDPQPWVVDIGRQADCTLFNYTDERIMAKYRQAGVHNIGGFWDAGTDPEVFFPRDVPQDKDVVFMGNNLDIPHDGYEKRRELIQRVLEAGFDLHLYGKGWEYLDPSVYPNLHLHPFVTEEEFANVCSSARITLGINGVNDVELYASWRRTVNTLACGAFHLTHYVPGMEQMITDKEHAVWFRSVDEALALVDYYLKHPQERRQIAEKGREKALASHTWDARIAQMLDYAEKCRFYADLRQYMGTCDAEIDKRGSTEVFRKACSAIWRSRDLTDPAAVKSAYNETDAYCYRQVAHNYQTRRQFFGALRKAVTRICAESGKPRLKLLDYGCGTACLEKGLADIPSLQITLADIPSRTFAFAKWRFKDHERVDFLGIDRQDCLQEQYDIVICFDVLEHIPEPMPVIRHLTEHLAPGGTLFLFFCTALPENNAGGHLKGAIDQYGAVMAYVDRHYDKMAEVVYRKRSGAPQTRIEAAGGRSDSLPEDRRCPATERFADILLAMSSGNHPKAVRLVRKHFVADGSALQRLLDSGLLNGSGDVLKIFARAFLEAGIAGTAERFLQQAERCRIADGDGMKLLKAWAFTGSGRFEDALALAPGFSAESALIGDFTHVMTEAVRMDQERKANLYIQSMANDLSYDRRQTYIVGLKPVGHDSHVSIVDRRGRVVFEAEEERYVRVKHSGNRPLNALLAGMRSSAIHPHQIRHIAFSFSAPEYETAASLWEKYYRENGFDAANAGMVRSSKAYAGLLREQEKYLKHLFPKAEIVHVKHHLAHSAGAFYTSPFRRSAILSVDGRGEFETIMLARGRKDRIEELETLSCPHSLGTLYQTMTYWLGLGARNEGKTMGLSSYGDPAVFYKTFRERIVDYDEDTGHFQVNREIIEPDGMFLYNHRRFDEIFGIREKMDKKNPQPVFGHVAAALQRVTEEIILALARRLRSISEEENLCMTGGVALNSVANGRVLQSGIFKDVSMHPAAHDGGTGLGAALYAYYNHTGTAAGRDRNWWVMEHPYLGDGYTEEEIRAAVRAAGFPLAKSDDAASFAAEKLSQGKIVGWFQGRMEVGPRALGNRSIVADPRDPAMKEKVNRRVKFRENWRPFAPSVLIEDCGIYFDSDHESPYMLFVYNARAEMRDRIPAVCHVDGTARVQTVDPKVNPRYYALIREFKKRTGVGLVLNTSMNVRGEPIVRTPKEAVDCFLKGGMDYMVLGDYILDKNDLPGTGILSRLEEGAARLNIPTRTGRLNGFVNVDVNPSKASDDVRCNLPDLAEFATDSIHLVHSHSYLHTLPKEKIGRLLSEWMRILVDGGRLILEVPDRDWRPSPRQREEIRARKKLENPAVFRHEEGTVTAFSFLSLEEILKEHGFRGVERLPASPFHPERIGSITVSAWKGSAPPAPAPEGNRQPAAGGRSGPSARRVTPECGEGPLKLHLGCGSVHLPGYVNIDVEDWAGACDLTADVSDLPMFGDNSVDHIFTHAVLEHIPPWDTQKALKEWARVLKPGATIQIDVPDLERIFEDWLVEGRLGEQEAIDNIFGGNKTPDKAYTHQDHLTGFTYDRLTRMMGRCGFEGFSRRESPRVHHNLVVWARKAGGAGICAADTGQTIPVTRSDANLSETSKEQKELPS